jgi:hypothetical protein
VFRHVGFFVFCVATRSDATERLDVGDVQLCLRDSLSGWDVAENDRPNGPEDRQRMCYANLHGDERPCGCRGTRQKPRNASASGNDSTVRFGPDGEFCKHPMRQMPPTANDKYGVSSMAESVTFTAFPPAAHGVSS